MGGAQYQAKCLLEKLIDRDAHEIYYIARVVDSKFIPRGYQVIKIGKANEEPRYGVSVDIFQLKNILNTIKPDVIYQRVACAYTGVAAWYSRRNNCKFIWHIAHDTDVSRSENNKIWRYELTNYFVRKFVDYGIKHTNHIIAQTAHQNTLLRLNYGKSADAVVPNFHPYPDKEIFKEGTVKIVWIANLKPWKQPETFIRLAKDLKYVEGAQFLMIGASPSKESEWFSSLLKEINSQNNLSYLGVCTQEKVNEILSSSHIFVNTSRYEGFANTFIQAWMRKVPVVSMHVNPDGIFDSEKVGFFAGNSYEYLKQKVELLIENAGIRFEIGENAQKYAFHNHSVKNAEKVIELLE